MKRITILLIMLINIILAGTRVYDIEPYRNCNSWTPRSPDNWVGQTFTAICDSFVWVDFFVGKSSPNMYVAQIFEDQQSPSPVFEGETLITQTYEFIHISMHRMNENRIVKGKMYLLKITNSNGDSINFYYDSTNSYEYGQISSGGGVFYPPPQQASRCDLAARIEGINKVDANWWGTHLYLTPMPEVWTQFGDGWGAWADTAKSAGVKWSREAAEWHHFQPNADTTFYFEKYDTAIVLMCNRDIQTFLPLSYSAIWASSAPSSVPDNKKDKYPPKNLFTPVIINQNNTIIVNPNNYWAYYVYKIMKYYGPSGRFLERHDNLYPITHFGIWNEPEDTIFWKNPDPQYYPGVINSRARCSLYARLCVVADSAARFALGSKRDSIKLYAGSISSNRNPNWLNWLFELHAIDSLNGYEIHPYPPCCTTSFTISSLDSSIQYTRARLGTTKELLITEIGWLADDNNNNQANQANSLLETYLSGLEYKIWGKLQEPLFWFSFPEFPDGGPSGRDNQFGLIKQRPTPGDTGPPGEPKMAYYSHKQMTENLRSKFFNCKVKNDTHPFYNFEFEDSLGKKFWIAWKQADVGEPATIKFPVRTNNVDSEPIEYSSGNNAQSVPANSDGWYSIVVDTTPIYIKEPQSESISRPDLVIDSLKVFPETLYAQKPCTLKCWIKNDANTPTPTGINIPIVFYHNDIRLDSIIFDTVIPAHSTIQLSKTITAWNIDTLPRTLVSALVKAVVNESRKIMELNFDNNSKYKMTSIRYYFQPDLQIKNGVDSLYIGDNIYNTDGTNQTKAQTVWQETAYYHIKIENDGKYAQDSILITGLDSDSFWQIRYIYDDTIDVTEDVNDSTFWLCIDSGDVKYLVVKVIPLSAPHESVKEGLITATSGYDLSKKDAVKTVTTSINPWLVTTVTTDRATGPNQGRHLVHKPNTSELYMVYEDSSKIYYSKSTNWGESWSASELIDEGNFPCISIGPYNGLPWIVWYNNGTYYFAVRRPIGTWRTNEIINGPAVLQQGKSIGPAMVHALTFDNGQIQAPSDLAYGVFTDYDSIYFAAFDTGHIYVRQSFLENRDSAMSAPSISITPGDYLHVVWQKNNPDQNTSAIYYSTAENVIAESVRLGNLPSWSGPYQISSESPFTEPASNPFIEAYGDSVYAVWRGPNEDGDSTLGDIWQSARWMENVYYQWEEPNNQSQTPDNESNYPVMSTDFVTVWHEQVSDTNWEIYGKFKPEQSAQPIFQTQTPSKYPQVVGYWDPNPYVLPTFCCNTMWTEEPDSGVYEVRFGCYRYEYNPIGSKGEVEKIPPYYIVGIGDSIPSPYCMHRNGYYKYGPYTIDFSNNKLKYKLPYLNPQYYYNLQAITYRAGQNNWTQELWTDSTLTGTIVTRPDEPETLVIRIPRESYRHDSKILQDLRKRIGNWAVVADLRLYQVESLENNGTGGIQSTEVQLLKRPILFQPFPNPFGSIATIRYFIPTKGNVTLTIYDVSGRALRTFVKGNVEAGLYMIRWNGKDDMNRTRGNGIYFIRLKTDDYNMTKKLVLVK